MSFLSLSTGDPAARDLLERAIRARYGLRPVPVESLRLWLSRPDKGPLGLPVQMHRTLSYTGATHWRQDDISKLFGLTIRRFTTSFEPLAYYEQNGQNVRRLDDSDVRRASRRFLWSHIAFMLTPLTMEGVTVNFVNETSFQAIRDADTTAVATISLDANDAVTVESEAYHPTTEKVTKFKLYGQGALRVLEGLTVPTQLVYQWGTEQPEAFTVTKVEVNPHLPKSQFALDEPAGQ